MLYVMTKIYLFSVAYVAALQKNADLRKENNQSREEKKHEEGKAEFYRKVSNAKTQECERLRGKLQKQDLPKQTSGNKPSYHVQYHDTHVITIAVIITPVDLAVQVEMAVETSGNKPS